MEKNTKISIDAEYLLRRYREYFEPLEDLLLEPRAVDATRSSPELSRKLRTMDAFWRRFIAKLSPGADRADIKRDL